MRPVDVGVRELRNNLSRHLARVSAGATVTVTDHGRPIARIVPIDRPTALERLRLTGRVTPAPQGRGRLPEPVEAAGTVSDLIDDHRR